MLISKKPASDKKLKFAKMGVKPGTKVAEAPKNGPVKGGEPKKNKVLNVKVKPIKKSNWAKKAALALAGGHEA